MLSCVGARWCMQCGSKPMKYPRRKPDMLRWSRVTWKDRSPLSFSADKRHNAVSQRAVPGRKAQGWLLPDDGVNDRHALLRRRATDHSMLLI